MMPILTHLRWLRSRDCTYGHHSLYHDLCQPEVSFCSFSHHERDILSLLCIISATPETSELDRWNGGVLSPNAPSTPLSTQPHVSQTGSDMYSVRQLLLPK